MNRLTIARVETLVLTICLLVGCGSPRRPSATLAYLSLQDVGVPARIAWIDDRHLLVQDRLSLSSFSNRYPLFLLDVTQAADPPRSVMIVSDCPAGMEAGVELLGSADASRVLLLHRCRLADGGFHDELIEATVGGDVQGHAMVPTVRIGSFSPLAQLGAFDYVPGSVAWLGGANRWLFTAGECGKLGWVGSDGAEPVLVPFSDGKVSWLLGDQFNETSCNRVGRVASPSWSPDGQQIAFWAAPGTVGIDGGDRFDVAANVYLSNPALSQHRRLASGFHYPTGLAWLKDKHLLMADNRGIAMIATADGSMTMLASGDFFQDVAVSTDAKRFATIRTDGKAPRVVVGTLR